jgi:ParB family transcriptional regulator, chromosome partitioning protein
MENDSDSTLKKRKKLALGRGIDALLPDMALPTDDSGTEGYQDCRIESIRPNRFQPRRRFSAEELRELAESIKEQGLIQPLIVRRDADGFELVAGERRLRACKLAGFERVPILVKKLTDAQMLEMSIVENIQREDLNPMETADAYHQLMDQFGLTQEQASQRVGKSRSSVANFLRLRQLPDEIKDGVREGALSMGHARALLGAATPAEQRDLFLLILKKHLSVRETEAMIQRLRDAAQPKPLKPPKSDDIYFKNLAETLSRQVGTKVEIRRQGKKGRLIIDFYGNEDLERLIQRLQADQ